MIYLSPMFAFLVGMVSMLLLEATTTLANLHRIRKHNTLYAYRLIRMRGSASWGLEPALFITGITSKWFEGDTYSVIRLSLPKGHADRVLKYEGPRAYKEDLYVYSFLDASELSLQDLEDLVKEGDTCPNIIKEPWVVGE